ncbi:MAG: hypothetical protein ACTSPI_13890, partial [Candidatus Heimdallarchaeaceae archaeon]
NGTTGARITLSWATGNAAGENMCGVLEIPNPSGQYKILSHQGAVIDSNGDARMCNLAGADATDTSQLETLRLNRGAGITTTSGEFYLIGIKDEKYFTSSSSSIDSSSSSSSSSSIDSSSSSSSIDSSSSSSFGDIPYTPLVTKTLNNDSSVEITIPPNTESLYVEYDLTASNDDARIAYEIEIGGSWYAIDAAHKNASGSDSANYLGSISNVNVAVGNATGECTSQSITLNGLQSTTLYPTALLNGGGIGSSGIVRMTQGAQARKTAGVITAIRIFPNSGTISGEVRSWAWDQGFACAGGAIGLAMKPVSNPIALSGLSSIAVPVNSNPLNMISIAGLTQSVDGSHLWSRVNGTAAAHKYHLTNSDSGSTAYSAQASNVQNIVVRLSSIGNATGESASKAIFIPNASSTSLSKPIWGFGAHLDSGGRCQMSTTAGYLPGTDAVTTLDLFPNTGTFVTGTVQCYELAFNENSNIGDTFNSATLLQRETGAGQTEIDFTLTAGYAKYLLVQLGVVLSGDGKNYIINVGTAGGVKTSDYKTHINSSDSNSSSYVGLIATTVASYANSAGNAAGENTCMIAEIPNPIGQYKTVACNGTFIDTNGSANMVNSAGAYTGDTDQLTTVRASLNGGTITSGEYYLIGIKDEKYITSSSSSSSIDSSSSSSSSIDSSSSSSFGDVPYTPLVTKNLDEDTSVEITIPPNTESLYVEYDLTASDDTPLLQWSMEIGGSWYDFDATHKTISDDASVLYSGSTSNNSAAMGNSTGEGVSQSIVFNGLQSTSLYPTAILNGGYCDYNTDVRTTKGAHVRKTAGAITAVKLSISSGTISGEVRSWAYDQGFTSTAGAIGLAMKPVQRVDFSGDASVTFSLNDNPLYMMSLDNLVPDITDKDVDVTVNGFSSDYKYHNGVPRSNSTAYNAGVSNLSNSLNAIRRLGTGTGETANMSLFVPNANSSSLFKPIWGAGATFDKDTLAQHVTLAGHYSGGTDALTSITANPSSANFASGSATLYELAFDENSVVGDTFNSATLLQRETASVETTMEFDLTSGYSKYLLVALGSRCTADYLTLAIRVWTAAGLKTADYKHHVNSSTSGSSTYAGGIYEYNALRVSTGNDTGENQCAIFEVTNPTNQYKIVNGQGALVSSNGS